MMIGALWEKFSLWIMHFGMPLVAVYHLVCSSGFLNVAAVDAKGLEKVGNTLLVPVQYILVGKEAIPVYEEGKIVRYQLEQRFNYEDPKLLLKTIGASLTLPPSLLLGSACKGVGHLFIDKERASLLQTSIKEKGQAFVSNERMYRQMGIELTSLEEAEEIFPEGHERRPGDENNLLEEKKALKEILTLLREYDIPHWLDCGTCLGSYRYGGSIPWDWDIDIAILQPDFDNVFHILSKLDKDKYTVQDWSSRDKPKTYLKVYVKKSAAIIDIYHFAINEEKQEVHSILSNEGSVFLPESWKIRERRYTIPTPFSYLFPLKKVDFDGIEAFVPAQTKKYLQQRYGENISPVKVYSAKEEGYVKDLTHPYWQDAHTR